MRPEARYRGQVFLVLSLIFLLKRRERSCVAAERIGGRYSLAFLFARDFGLARNSRHLPPSSFRPSALPCPLARPAKHTRAHTDSPFFGRLKPFPHFYILDEIPAALCPFITFTNQMMSLDILRLYCRLLCRSNGFRETNSC